MGQQSADERRKTVADQLTESVKKLMAEQQQAINQRIADFERFYEGALEQLVFQQGQWMTAQAGIIEYLDELSTKRGDDVGADVRIKSIVEQNIARARAERAAEEAKNAKPALASVPPEEEPAACPSCGSLSPDKCNQPCTDPPASANRPVDDPALGEARPANIAPEAPAVAPANPPGDA